MPWTWHIVSTIYNTRDISFWMCYVLFDLAFQGQRSRWRCWYTFFKFCDFDLVAIDTKHKFLRYILPEISYWMRYVMFDLEFQGQGHNHETYFFEFPDIHLVILDTKNKFLPHVPPEISYWMSYVMFDLEFQGQRSRSQPWDLFCWIPWHPLSNRGHQKQVFITCTTRDIILNALRHVWPWISRLKVKVTILAYNFLNSLTSV